MIDFYQFLAERLEAGGFATEDVLSSFLPLAREVLESHAAGFVAPLEGLHDLHVEGVQIWFEEAKRRVSRLNEKAVRSVQTAQRAAVEIVAETRRVTEVGDESAKSVNLAIGDADAPVTRPVYLLGYQAWEHRLEHHDPLTDIFSLGMILASLACSLDFCQLEDLEAFVASRRNLFSITPSLHPVLAQAITRMTALDRADRAQDLTLLVHALENYRDQKVDLEFELAKIQGFASEDRRTKQTVVLGKLRERLFDVSRRNRLLHFQPTMQSVNLTHASVPLSFDIKNIRPDQIFVWNSQRQAEFTAGKDVSLNRFLNFAEALYLPSFLDRIMAESKRDRAEFGFAQLRLVVCFLRWTNVKEKPIQRYDSPLILLPVELKKQKGIRDTYLLEPQTSEAEINPVVRHEFKRLYDIDLPTTIDLTQIDADQFFAFLDSRVVASASAVTLQKIERPRIALIHDKARRKLDQYRRRARLAGRGVRRFGDFDYSYDPANHHPLGIKLFAAKIRSPSTRLRSIIEEKPRPRTFAVAPAHIPTAEKERSFYSLEEGETNPYTWHYDLCSVTLANFKYRRMSLVRDYDTLLEQQPSNPGFEATFSLQPRPDATEIREAPPLAERFDVVSCDPTQATAVGEARAGQSYIIQGPPGTGKSQTITNLIADYVARDQRVLFVCEKRAAIDVVFARLRQRGLSNLCCLIHDSQTDKKEFVMDLKQTYDGYLDEGSNRSRPQRTRDAVLKQFAAELQPLENFDRAMQTALTEDGFSLRRLLDRATKLRDALPALSPLEKEFLPPFEMWHAGRGQIERFINTLRELEPDGILARHPLRLLSPRVTEVDRPLETISATIDQALHLLQHVEQLLGSCGIPRDFWNTLDQADALIGCMSQISPLADVDQLMLLDTRSERAKRFAGDVKTLRDQRKALADAHETAKAWRERLPEPEVGGALEQAQRFEQSHLPWLKPSWWRLRRVLKRCYDFKSHVIPPSWSQTLAILQKLYGCEAEVRVTEQSIGETHAIKNEVEVVVEQVSKLREAIPRWPAPLVRLLGGLVKSAQAKRIVSRVLEAASSLNGLRNDLGRIMDGFADRPLSDVKVDAVQAQQSLQDLPDFLHCLSQLGELPQELAAMFRRLPLTAVQLEAAIADKTLETTFRANRSVSRFNGLEYRRRTRRIAEIYDQLLDANALAVRDRVRDRFQEHLRLSGYSAAQLNAEQKEFKKSYNRGRRDLEHEFGKSMRFRAIRDLVSGDCGAVVKDLKPVWLMSPLSVSDTLPLDSRFFDVVIFDEASQITLEEAVPSLFRASQAIVVGDEMQLPPTSFFEAKQRADDEGLLIDEEGELVRYELESNSFLNHAAANLPATMLGWHYRSRSESLISFSNWAFYEGRLLTVPEEQIAAAETAALDQHQADDAERGADELLQRAISFHYLTYGIYEKRRNRAEADYIAHLVRRLLSHHHGPTIAVVAFSEAQQSEIEDALQQLAHEDSNFRELYEAELEREDDGQFVGLLIKNLENIQGDERDIVILSVCYGRDPHGKIRMNFGPINMGGGEKRLNVAFSRAKHHMAVVSSIHFGDITNDYNEGANCFKNYLRYAEAVSLGRTDAARRVLHGLCRWHETDEQEEVAVADAVSDQLTAELVIHGFLVDRAVGQSHFRCDLAVRRPGDTVYRLGILVDGDTYYEQADVLERDVMRPRLLQNFGWNVCQVLAKDWYQTRKRVLDRLLRLLAGESEVAIDASTEQEAADTAPEAIVAKTLYIHEATNAPANEQDAQIMESACTLDYLPLGDEVDTTSADTELATPAMQIDGRMTRYFEFTNDCSAKFWEITLHGNSHSVRFGRIGNAGQERTKEFNDPSIARADFERLVRQKFAKGYVEKPV